MKHTLSHCILLAVLQLSISICPATVVYASDDKDFTSFTFVQMCDTQLGMGGYEHDIKTFRQAVNQINDMNADFVVICGDLVDSANDSSFADFITIKDDFTVAC
jgi:hypothetical protein